MRRHSRQIVALERRFPRGLLNENRPVAPFQVASLVNSTPANDAFCKAVCNPFSAVSVQPSVLAKPVNRLAHKQFESIRIVLPHLGMASA
jgi:hypothetical protein